MWKEPPMPKNIPLLYQLCYWRKDEQVSRKAPCLYRWYKPQNWLLTDVLFFFRAALSKMLQWAPRLTAFWSPSWPRPRTTRSRSDVWLPLEPIPCTWESRRNGADPQTGPHLRVRVLAANMATCLYQRRPCKSYLSCLLSLYVQDIIVMIMIIMCTVVSVSHQPRGLSTSSMSPLAFVS